MGLKVGSRHQKGGGGGGGGGNGVSTKWVSLFCIASFFLGVLVVDRLWDIPDPVKLEENSLAGQKRRVLPSSNCEKKETSIQAGGILDQVSQTHNVIMNLEETISSLEMQLAAARAAKASNQGGSTTATGQKTKQNKDRQKVFFVMGIMTAFSSRKRRDSIRQTWMPQGEELRKLEKQKGIVMLFVIGHSATPGGILDRAIDAEEEQHHDFFRLDHVEGYHELSSKTKIYFTTAVARWDADFYIKADDDVHVNPGMLGSTLARYRSKARIYMGCMKSGPVLAQKSVKYYEPEYWKFGVDGNKYFRHATGQLYVVSKDLATYISVNRHILHRFANEDVSLGSWFIGLDVEHIDDRTLCCGTSVACISATCVSQGNSLSTWWVSLRRLTFPEPTLLESWCTGLHLYATCFDALLPFLGTTALFSKCWKQAGWTFHRDL